MIVLLMLIGAGIIYTLLQYVYKRFWAKNLTVDIAFDKAYTYMGTEAVITETVTNMKALIKVLISEMQIVIQRFLIILIEMIYLHYYTIRELQERYL